MEDIHTADHCRLTHEGKRVNSPGDAADLRIHLDEHLRDDTAQILAFLDGANKHNLRGYWELLEQEPLHVIVKRALAFLPREK